MTATDNKQVEICNELQLLTFSINGTRMGVDTSQISEMMEQEEAEARGMTILKFSDEVPFRETDFAYVSPKVLKIKNTDSPAGVVIDQAEDITSVSVSSIRPLPYLVEISNRTKTIWGVAVMDNDIILLVDFYKLKCVPLSSRAGSET